MSENKPSAATQAAQLTIGAVSRATGLSPDILRVWQKRYGFPVPKRKPSGHRLYAPSDVRRLRRIAQAIARGHRPAQVVPLSEPRLETLLVEDDLVTTREEARLQPIAAMLELLRNRRRQDLTAALLADAASMSPLEFLESRITPLSDAIGEAWACGETGLQNERLYSECAEEILRTIRLPYERSALGPSVILATLPGEHHGLGLEMMALVTAVAGLRPHVLGTDTPVTQIADAWVTRNAEAIGISVSLTSGAAARLYLGQLRETIPTTVPIFVGGRGARRACPPAGVAVVQDLRKVHDWMRMLRARAS